MKFCVWCNKIAKFSDVHLVSNNSKLQPSPDALTAYTNTTFINKNDLLFSKPTIQLHFFFHLYVSVFQHLQRPNSTKCLVKKLVSKMNCPIRTFLLRLLSDEYQLSHVIFNWILVGQAWEQSSQFMMTGKKCLKFFCNGE